MARNCPLPTYVSHPWCSGGLFLGCSLILHWITMTLAVWRCPSHTPRIEKLSLCDWSLLWNFNNYFFPFRPPLSDSSYPGLSTALLEVPSRQKSWRPPGGLPLYADYKGHSDWSCWGWTCRQKIRLSGTQRPHWWDGESQLREVGMWNVVTEMFLILYSICSYLYD